MSEDERERYLLRQQQYVAKMRNERVNRQIKARDKPILSTPVFWMSLLAVLLFGTLLLMYVFVSMSIGKGTIGDTIAKGLALVLMEMSFCKDYAELQLEPRYQIEPKARIAKKLVKILVEYLTAVGLITWILVPTNHANFIKFSQDWTNMFKILVPMLIQGIITIWISDITSKQGEWLAD